MGYVHIIANSQQIEHISFSQTGTKSQRINTVIYMTEPYFYLCYLDNEILLLGCQVDICAYTLHVYTYTFVHT